MKKDDLLQRGSRIDNALLEKIWKIMRLTGLFLLISFVAISAETYSQNSRFSFKMENSTLNNLFLYLEQNSEYRFAYNKSDLDDAQKISCEFTNESIDQILKKVLDTEKLRISIKNEYIIITSRESSAGNSFKDSQSVKSISGRVTDSSGGPLPGVSVVVKGTTTGVITDADGNYKLANVSEKATLQFSFVGMKTQEVIVAGKAIINVTLAEETIGIEEVVAVGYGTQRRSEITGAISSLNQQNFAKQQAFRATDALQGRIAGVQVTNTSGSPFAATKIRIRGTNSINGGNDPLYVVDGVVGGGMPNAEDIESIEVLKDASATALYGSRGANGVILVSTKKGVAGKVKITVDTYGTLNTPSKYYDLLDAATYAEAYNYTVNSTVFSKSEIENFRKNGGTDWQRAVLQNAWIQRYRLNVSGGNEKARFYVTADYKKQDAMIVNKYVEDFGFSSRLDADLFKNLKLEWLMSVRRYENRNNAALNGGGDAILFNALTYGPTDPIYTNEEKTKYLVIGTQGQSGNSPVLEALERDSRDKGIRTSSNMSLTWNIIKGLTAQYRLNLNYSTNGYYEFKNNQYNLGRGSTANGNKSEGISYFQNFVLNYNKSIDKHSFGATAVVEGSKYEGNSVSYTDQGFLNDLLGYWGIGTGTSKSNNVGYGNEGLFSYLGRLNYNYSGKYYLTGTYRADGSSKFAKGNKWGYFPSASVAWRASEENFIKNLGIFSNLKVRSSFGITGNQAVGQYSTIPQLVTDTGNGNNAYSPFYNNPTVTIGYAPRTVNTELTWESTKQIDFGLDLGFFDERLTATIDLYKKHTYDLLLTETAPYYLGGDQTTRNKGEVDNKGIEFAVTALPIMKKDLKWEISVNFAKNVNKIVDIGQKDPIYLNASQGNNDGTLDSKTHILRNGLSMGTLWGWKCLGVWQKSEAALAAKYGQSPGDWKYADMDNNYEINEDDRTIIGKGTPDFSWGLNTTITYKNLDVNLLLQGVQGAQMLNVVYAATSTRASRAPSITLREGWEKAWRPDAETNEFANPQSTSAMMKYNSDRWVQNASFMRIKNLCIGYTFNKSLLKIGEVRLYVSSQNLLTITRYKGYDPEAMTTAESDTGTGVDFGANPTPRSFTFGAQLNF